LTPIREWLQATENARDWFGKISGRSNNQDWDDIFQQIHLLVQPNSDLVELLDEFERDGWPKADICHAIIGNADDDEGDDSESTAQDEDDVSFFSVDPPMKSVHCQEAIPLARTFSEKRMEIATQLGDALNFHTDLALAVLPAFRWILTDAIEQLVSGDQNNIFHKLGLPPSSRSQELFLAEVPARVCDSCKRKETCLKLHCQHTFCETCWCNEIGTAINAGETQVTCIHPQCHAKLMESDVRSRCSSTQLDTFVQLLLREFVRHRSVFKRCPSCFRPRPLFQNAMGPIDIVTCSECRSHWCWRCLCPPHGYCTCEQSAEWLLLPTRRPNGPRIIRWYNERIAECNDDARNCPDQIRDAILTGTHDLLRLVDEYDGALERLEWDWTSRIGYHVVAVFDQIVRGYWQEPPPGHPFAEDELRLRLVELYGMVRDMTHHRLIQDQIECFICAKVREIHSESQVAFREALESEFLSREWPDFWSRARDRRDRYHTPDSVIPPLIPPLDPKTRLMIESEIETVRGEIEQYAVHAAPLQPLFKSWEGRQLISREKKEIFGRMEYQYGKLRRGEAIENAEYICRVFDFTASAIQWSYVAEYFWRKEGGPRPAFLMHREAVIKSFQNARRLIIPRPDCEESFISAVKRLEQHQRLLE
jgi:hypothetical protein